MTPSLHVDPAPHARPTATTSPGDDPPSAASHLVTGVGASGDLTPAQVRERLLGDGAEDLLDRLGITGDDRADLAPLIPAVLDDPDLLAEVTAAANLLRSAAGLDVEPAPLGGETKKRHDALQQRIAPGEGLIPILTFVAATDTVRAWHTARGIGEEDSWRVLSDLGQQMRVHRRGSGRLGLHQVPWTAMNWAGRLFHLGRLQFDLHRAGEADTREGGTGGVATSQAGTGGVATTDERRWVIGTHIPATGPLDPDAVDASFAAAREFFPRHFPDLALRRPANVPAFGHEYVCDSWLMNPELPAFLGSGSNIGAFVERWEVIRTSDGDDSAAFFVFGARPPYDPADLPRRTTLEREVAQRLSDGRGWRNGVGSLVLEDLRPSSVDQ